MVNISRSFNWSRSAEGPTEVLHYRDFKTVEIKSDDRDLDREVSSATSGTLAVDTEDIFRNDSNDVVYILYIDNSEIEESETVIRNETRDSSFIENPFIKT